MLKNILAASRHTYTIHSDRGAVSECKQESVVLMSSHYSEFPWKKKNQQGQPPSQPAELPCHDTTATGALPNASETNATYSCHAHIVLSANGGSERGVEQQNTEEKKCSSTQ